MLSWLWKNQYSWLSYDRYTREEQKERERAYGYVRSILKSVLEDS